MLGLKLNHVSERGPWYPHLMLFTNKFILHDWDINNHSYYRLVPYLFLTDEENYDGLSLGYRAQVMQSYLTTRPGQLKCLWKPLTMFYCCLVSCLLIPFYSLNLHDVLKYCKKREKMEICFIPKISFIRAEFQGINLLCRQLVLCWSLM